MLVLTSVRSISASLSCCATLFSSSISPSFCLSQNFKIPPTHTDIMSNSCEIPQGREYANKNVNDEPPSASALKAADAIELYDENSKKHTFKSIYNRPDLPKRVLVVFVRHFYCCVSQVSHLNNHLPIDILVMRSIHQMARRKRHTRKAQKTRHGNHHSRPRRCKANRNVSSRNWLAVSHLHRALREDIQYSGYD